MIGRHYTVYLNRDDIYEYNIHMRYNIIRHYRVILNNK